VIYSRILTYTPPASVSLSSVQEPIEFSVVGPGAKLKIYVAPEVLAQLSLAQAATAQESIIGAVGGWRGVGQESRKAMAVQQTVDILSYEQMEILFEELEPLVALNYMPIGLVDSREVLTHTLAYYEHEMGTGQDQLIPVYALTARYTLEGGGTTTDTVYIPANEEFMAPLAALTYTVGMPLTPTVRVGQQIVLEAVDASKTLAEIGYDGSLDFALGTGDPDSYLYTWYLNTVADENRIGTGRVLTYTVGLNDGQGHDEVPEGGSGIQTGSLIHQAIILEVTDGLSPRPPSTSRTTFQIDVVPPIYLPLVLKSYATR